MCEIPDVPVVALSSLVMAAPEAVARGGDVCSNGVTKCCESTHEVSHALCLFRNMTAH